MGQKGPTGPEAVCLATPHPTRLPKILGCRKTVPEPFLAIWGVALESVHSRLGACGLVASSLAQAPISPLVDVSFAPAPVLLGP